jgi:2,3-bisphosphoglycerate-independent phosphoglycerate mutase
MASMTVDPDLLQEEIDFMQEVVQRLNRTLEEAEVNRERFRHNLMKAERILNRLITIKSSLG